MILQRIANAIRRQHWGTLVLELVVVVVGIFLGLQADDWNQARKDAAGEVVYLQRLLADTEEMIAAHERHVLEADQKIRHVLISLEALRTCELSPEAAKALDLALLDHQSLPRIPVIRASYDEMVATGALARIDDQALKNTISETYAFAAAAQDFVDYFSADLGRASDIIWRHVAFNIKSDSAVEKPWSEIWRDEDFYLGVDYDFETLCRSPELVNGMVEVFDSVKDRLGVGYQLARQLEELRAMLTRRLDPPEG